MAEKIICVVGPTACGKTKLGVLLAKRYDGEVVSADSMQIYKGMTIGTAAPTAEEMEGVPHHMIAVADPAEQWSAARYARAAVPIVDDILRRGKRPILVGGTGLWLDAVVQGRTFAGGHAGGAVRRELQAQLAAQGVTIVSEKGFKWPSYATTITSLFGSRTHPVTGRPNNHTGVDIAAAGGTDIWAAKSGVVLTSTYNSSYGNYVVISHANGESTLYAHMSKRLVSEGDKVTQGQTIGLVGTTGSSTGNHLHFEVRLNGQRQDPLNYFRGSTFTLRASGKSVSYTVS